MARQYARTPRGVRAIDIKPHDRGRVHSIVGAIGLRGVVATMAFEGWLDKPAWLLFVRELLHGDG